MKIDGMDEPGIHQGEDSGVRADAETERQDGDQDKTGALAEHAEGEPEVV
jgi:hypothetical protein